MSRQPKPDRDIASRQRGYGPARLRRLTAEVELEFDARIPLADGYIVTALADALAAMDEQGLLFPGVDHPRHRERLLDWRVMLVGSGRRSAALSPLERRIEARRREGDIGPRLEPRSEAGARRRDEAEEVLAAIDDLEPRVLALAEAAWRATVRLRHAAAMLADDDASAHGIAAAVVEGRRAVDIAGELVGPGDASDAPS